MFLYRFDNLAGIPDRQTVGGYWPGDNASGTDYAVIADSNAGQYDYSATNPDIVSYRNRQRSCTKEQLSRVFIPVFHKSLGRTYRVGCSVELHVGSYQDIISYRYIIVIEEGTVHVDNHFIPDKDMFAAFAVEVYIDSRMFSDATE